jgi:hypothetical protein
MHPNDIVIVLEGGLVQSVSLGNRYLRNKLGEAVIVDLDVEDADLAEIDLTTLPDGTETEAVIHNQPIERRPHETKTHDH